MAAASTSATAEPNTDLIATPSIPEKVVAPTTLQTITGWAPGIALAAALGWTATNALAVMTSPAAGAVKLIYAGAIAGVLSRTCCAPLEMVSTVMMCRGDECQSMWGELGKAWQKEGVGGLFKGNFANCLKVAPSRGTQFLVYEFVKRRMLLTGLFMATAGAPLNAGARLFAGGIAGMVAAAIVYPLETVKTVLTLFPDECTGVVGAMRTIMKKGGGVGGLYRGLAPTLLAMFPYVGVEFMVYETLKGRYTTAFGVPGTAILLGLGALGGAAAQISAHPLDVVRRRMQMQGMAKGKPGQKKIGNLFSGLYGIAKTEGAHVLFKGLGPACLEKAPSTAIGYFVYEAMKQTLGVVSV